MREWMTMTEVEETTGISRTGLVKAIERGSLRATKPARKILIHRDDLKAFMESGRILPKQSA